MARYFPVLTNNTIRIKDFEERMPRTAQTWRKLQIVNGGDTMRGVGDPDIPICNTEGRDNSFVRVCPFSPAEYINLTSLSVHAVPRSKRL
jgi:hypothetical protein